MHNRCDPCTGTHPAAAVRRPKWVSIRSRNQTRIAESRPWVAPWKTVMAELINLRLARKRAQRLKDERQADNNRLAHGEPKALRARRRLEDERSERAIDAHRREREDGE